jgi:hypothetical protein
VEYGLNNTEFGLVLKRNLKLRNTFRGEFWCGLIREMVEQVHSFQLRAIHDSRKIPRSWFDTEMRGE